MKSDIIRIIKALSGGLDNLVVDIWLDDTLYDCVEIYKVNGHEFFRLCKWDESSEYHYDSNKMSYSELRSLQHQLENQF